METKGGAGGAKLVPFCERSFFGFLWGGGEEGVVHVHVSLDSNSESNFATCNSLASSELFAQTSLRLNKCCFFVHYFVDRFRQRTFAILKINHVALRFQSVPKPSFSRKVKLHVVTYFALICIFSENINMNSECYFLSFLYRSKL